MMRLNFFCFVIIGCLWPHSSEQRNPRIFDGEHALEGQFPWQVALYIEKNTGMTFCGGAIISDSWVLTAAHCINGAYFRIRVLMGTTKSTGDDPGQVEVHATDWVIYDEFDPWEFVGDLALVKLPEPLVFDDYIKPIALASEALAPNTPVTISGWGATNSDGTRSSDLNYSTLFTSDSCSDVYNTRTGIICAVPDPNSEAQNICGGDSGGALVANATTNPVHIGIVSFYVNCSEGLPGGFTSTAYYRQWIKDNTGL